MAKTVKTTVCVKILSNVANMMDSVIANLAIKEHTAQKVSYRSMDN